MYIIFSSILFTIVAATFIYHIRKEMKLKKLEKLKEEQLPSLVQNNRVDVLKDVDTDKIYSEEQEDLLKKLNLLK